MYYVWDAQMRWWRKRMVRLELDWEDGYPPPNNTCVSLQDRLPPTLRYRLVPMRAPLLDQMWSASSFDVYSPAARKLLGDIGAQYEEVPAIICGSADRVITSEYAFVHVTACLKAVDWEHSDVDVGTDWKGEPYVRHTRHLVLKQEVIQENIPVLRLVEKGTVVLVSQDFRAEWERRGLTGALFRSLAYYPNLRPSDNTSIQ